MNPIDLIIKKRDGGELTKDELHHLISGYVAGDIPEYQISAFLMATYFQDMQPREIATLTRLMRDSGVVLDFSDIAGFKADKHSTGGVGDKVSLILAPLLASAGVLVPMISGRALAHTGGTLDKLEAIPGFRTDLSLPEIRSQLEQIGVALVGQTADLCPADKKIYALRDATGTVNSIPLITASILSKKMAEGIDALVLDVKSGSGAMFREHADARKLAQMLVETADFFDLKTTAILTSMVQPLGNTVGNWLETREAIDCLRGEGPEDLRELCLVLSAQLLVDAGKAEAISSGIGTLAKKLDDGTAFDKFIEIVKRQGGDTTFIESPNQYEAAAFTTELTSESNGFLAEIDCRGIGWASMALGAGRRAVEDGIDYTAGIELVKKVGDSVREGETLAVVHTRDHTLFEKNRKRLQQAFAIGESSASPPKLILGRISTSGEQSWNSKKSRFE